jgi:hypothetical protein
LKNQIKGKDDLNVSIEVMLVKEGDFWVALAHSGARLPSTVVCVPSRRSVSQ